MPAVGLTQTLRKGSRKHREICERLQRRIRRSESRYGSRHETWRKAEEQFLAYLPERDVDAARRLNRDNGGMPQYTTLVLPYTYALLMSAHTYWTTVFMARAPILQFSGRHGESEQQVQALEALMDYQVQVGGLAVPLYIWLFDMGKYGVGIVGNYWDRVEVITSEIKEVEELIMGVLPSGKMRKERVPVRVPGYEGNRLFNVRPYDFFPDPQVPLHRFQEGEFCGVYVELNWPLIARRADQGIYMNVEELKKHKSRSRRDQGLARHQEWPEDYSTNDPDKEGLEYTQKNLYEVYVNLIPAEWGLGKETFMEKWVFTVTSDFSLLIGAQPLGAHHGMFPFFVQESEPEGYALTPRSIPEVVLPLQNTLDWLVNSHFYNVRKVLNDQFLVDPSKIMIEDVLDPLPGGIIRLQPATYGDDPNSAITQLKVTDVTQQHIGDMASIMSFGERTTGINEQLMGMLNQGGRRSATEARISSSFGVNRMKTSAEFASAMGWGPLAQALVQNSQQYYDAEKKFRIVGELIQEAGAGFVNVTPETIQGFYDFVPVDGTLPVDRFA